MFSITLMTGHSDVIEGSPAFHGVVTDTSGGMITATLTSLTVASTVEGTMVTSLGESSVEGPLTITVVGE